MDLGRVLATMGLWFCCAGAVATVVVAPTESPTEAARSELRRVRAKPDNRDRWIDEARLLFYLGEIAGDADEQMKRFTEGRDLADKARKADPKSAGALLWWAANHGGVARLKRNLWSLGALKEIEAALLELKALDPDYGHGAASRVLGKIYLEAPRFVSIGSPSRAKEFILDSLKRGPNFPGNELGYAEWLWEDGAKREAGTVVRRLREQGAIEKGEHGDFNWERPLWRQRLEALHRRTQEVLP
jgi:tetratricopeptide (TPR) repeat protein